MTHLESLEKEREQLLQRLQEIDEQISELKRQKTTNSIPPAFETQIANKVSQSVSINKYSSVTDKINLYHSLFRGQQDVFARRFESAKTGKSGYQPVCENEWGPGVCKKKKSEMRPMFQQKREIHATARSRDLSVIERLMS